MKLSEIKALDKENFLGVFGERLPVCFVRGEGCTLYDQDGNQIGTAIDNISDLTPDSTWKYTAMTLDTEQFASFELTSVDAW